MITLTIFASNYGESILIKLPNGEYGVVDCFARNYKEECGNHILDYFRELGGYPTKLKFICWTHPHEDHSRGLLKLIEKFRNRIDEFWCFMNVDPYDYLAYLRAVKKKLLNSNNEDLKKLVNLVHYKVDIMEKIKGTEGKQGYVEDANIKEIELNNILLPGDNLNIYALSPHQTCRRKYQNKVRKTLINGVDDSIRDFNELPHNMISCALVISYGLSKILLGADTENDNWEVIYNKSPNNPGKYPMHLIKVPHHGSKGAYFDKYWDIWTSHDPLLNTKTISVVTPFVSGKNNLPDQVVVNKLFKNCRCFILQDNSKQQDIIDVNSLRAIRLQSPTTQLLKSGLNKKAKISTKVHRITFTINQCGDITLIERSANNG